MFSEEDDIISKEIKLNSAFKCIKHGLIIEE
jgi:hypothetical protein